MRHDVRCTRTRSGSETAQARWRELGELWLGFEGWRTVPVSLCIRSSDRQQPVYVSGLRYLHRRIPSAPQLARAALRASL